MASYPPNTPPPPPGAPPPGYDPRAYGRYMRDQARAQREAFRAQRDQMRYQFRSYRRGSVLGPMLLIGAGIVVLLLQTGRLAPQHFWGWYGRWWPLLLVAAGVVVLAEWALDQYHMRDPQRPPYRRSIGGGIFWLLVILVVVGASAHHHMGDNGDWRGWGNGIQIGPDSLDEFMGDKHESDLTTDYQLAAGGSLTVVNPHGDVTIHGTSDDNNVHVAVHKQVYARTDSDADAKAQQLTPTTATSGSALTITEPPVEGGRADLVITVPANAALSVTSNHGDIHVADIQAPVSATANHGDIELSSITGPVTAHANNNGSSISAHGLGDGITIQGHAQDLTLADVTGAVSINGEFFGTTHFQHVNGAIHFHTSRADFQMARLDGEAELDHDMDISASQVLGPLVLTTHNGNVTLDRVAGDVAVTNRNGTIELTAAPALGNITLEDRNGSVEVTMPEKSGFSVQATTTNGDLDSDFQLPTNENNQQKTLSGVVGGGGPTMHLTTTNGDIALHKGTVEPVPPTPPAPPKFTLTPQGAAVSAVGKKHKQKPAPVATP